MRFPRPRHLALTGIALGLCFVVLRTFLPTAANSKGSLPQQLEWELATRFGLRCPLPPLKKETSLYPIDQLSISPLRPTLWQKARLYGVSAETSWLAKLRKTPVFATLKARRLELDIDAPNRLQHTQTRPPPLLPNKSSFEQIHTLQCDEIAITWPLGEQTSTLELGETTLHSSSIGEWDLQAESAILHIAGLPSFQIGRVQGTCSAKGIQINQTEILNETGDVIGNLEGQLDAEGRVTLTGNLTSLPLDSLLQDSAGARQLSGSLAGTWRYTSTTDPETEVEAGLHGDFELMNGYVSKFPPFLMLAEILENESLGKLALPLSGQLHWSPGRFLSLRQWSGSSPDASLSGAIEVTDKDHQLHGQLNLTLPIDLASPRALPALPFARISPEGDKLILPLRLSGTVGKPTEDLSARLQASAFIASQTPANKLIAPHRISTEAEEVSLLEWFLEK